MSSDEIDVLLERYLSLLAAYTELRSTLAALQSSVYQSISRANFSAERGLRYGQDQYDARVQATRLLSISTEQAASQEPDAERTAPSSSVQLQFSIAPAAPDSSSTPSNESTANDAETETKPASGTPPTPASSSSPPPADTKPRDPLRMFGMLAPASLRDAQRNAVALVQDVIPQLVGVEREMLDVEIEIRRARKKLAKQARDKGQAIESTKEATANKGSSEMRSNEGVCV